MKNIPKKPNGFTLVELLIAVSIFMILMGITAKLLATLSDLGKKSIAVVEMHQQAFEIINVFTNDMRNMHLTTAFSLSFEDQDIPQSTFMTNQKKEQGKGGGSYGPYSVAPDKTNTDFMWVRWECDLMNGNLKRGRTRPSPSTTTLAKTDYDSLHSTDNRSTKGISQYQRFATPQTEMVYFEGKGSSKIGSTVWTWNADSGIKASEKRRMYQLCQFQTSDGGKRSDRAMRFNKHYKYFIFTHSVVGNRRLLSEECYAVKNADGMTYNKDRLNLIGAPDETDNPSSQTVLYPNQIAPLNLHPNFECTLISYHLADGTPPADDDTLSDANASLDVKGTGPQLRASSSAIINNRPDYVLLSFLSHNVPNDDPDIDDIDNDPSTVHFIDAVRNKVHVQDGTALTRVNYLLEMRKRQEAMSQLIKDNGYIVQRFSTSVALAK